jgi:pilus assembly protein CpaC
VKNFIAFLALSVALSAQEPVQPWTKQPVNDTKSAQQTAVQSGDGTPTEVNLKVNRSTVIDFKPGFRRVSITSADIAEAVAVSSTELLLNGKSAGDTSLIIWDLKGGRTNFDVHVSADQTAITAIREQLAKEVGPDVSIAVQGKDVFLRGTVQDEIAAGRANNIASAAGKVVNLLRVLVPPAEPQILLKVRFASLDRTLSTQLGINLFALGGVAKGVVSSTTGQFGSPPALSQVGPGGTATLTNLLNLFYFRPDIDLGAVLQDLEAKNVLQILAEPNVLALSGHPASFLAGGEFPFPTLQGGGSGVGQVTIQFREFGIRLKFLPTLTPRGSIHLVVSPEVSSLDYSNGLTVSGFTIPGLATRRVETEVELQNGQSFAIAGLLDNQLTETFNRMPGISSIPILGKFFESRSVSKNNNELLVVVTPELVQPIPASAKSPDLERPMPFLPGQLPSNWKNPLDPAAAAAIMSVPESLPVEEIKAMSGAADQGQAAPKAYSAVPGSTSAQGPSPAEPSQPAPTPIQK